MMASKFPVDELIKRAIDLNARYYSGMGQLMVNYVKDLVVTFSNVSTTLERQPGQPTNPSAHKAQQSPVMVLEAESGKEALGVFLVENHLKHDIAASAVASHFVDVSQNEIKPTFVFDPETVTLRPGEQSLVRVTVQIDDTFAPDVRYEGFLHIPELPESKVRMVLRRRPVAPNGTSS